jgi:arylsulfatase A-like enzyme
MMMQISLKVTLLEKIYSNIIATDDFLAEYFKNLYEENIMDDTFVIFFGDHGSRFGPLRQTAQGKLEERLPLNLFFAPKRFLENHPTYRLLVT